MRAGYEVGLAASSGERYAAVSQMRSRRSAILVTDASSADSIVQLFLAVDRALGAPEVVLFNPSARIRGELLSLDIAAASAAIQTTVIGALVTAQEAARRMLPRSRGTNVIRWYRTAGVKGFAVHLFLPWGEICRAGVCGPKFGAELGIVNVHVALLCH